MVTAHAPAAVKADKAATDEAPVMLLGEELAEAVKVEIVLHVDVHLIIRHIVHEKMGDVRLVLGIRDKDELIQTLRDDRDVCGLLCSRKLDGGGQLVLIHSLAVQHPKQLVHLVQPLAAGYALKPPFPCRQLPAVDVKPKPALHIRRRTKADKRLFDRKLLVGKQK